MLSTYYQIIVRKQYEIEGGPLVWQAHNTRGSCPVCGTGIRGVGSRKFGNLSFVKSDIWIDLDYEIILRREIAKEFESKGISAFVDVVSRKNGHLLPWVMLAEQATLPPWSSETTGFVRDMVCQVCKRDGYFNTLKQDLFLVYKNLPRRYTQYSILATYERFGKSVIRDPITKSHIAGPIYTVSDRFKQISERLQLKNIEFIPTKIQWAESAEEDTRSDP